MERVDHVDLFMYGRYSKNYFSLDKELSLIIGPDRKTFELTLIMITLQMNNSLSTFQALCIMEFLD